MDDAALLAHQTELQREAAAFVHGVGLPRILGHVGRVVPLGSAVTGLMVWRDVDYGVDAPGLTRVAAWDALQPLLGRCASLRYLDEHEERRHYFVMRIDGWKVDLSLWSAGIPPAVESFQAGLIARLTDDARLTILRLKHAWCSSPAYPEIVSAWEIYDAVLNNAVRTLDELDDYLVARGLPTRDL